MRTTARFATVLCLALSLASSAVAVPPPGDPVPKEPSTDPTYGYSETNPIKVGQGPENQRRFLAALRGPDGQKLDFRRLGSCCPYKTPNAMFGDEAPLDAYEITYRGLAKPIVLYLSFYDYEPPKIPVGLTRGE